MTTLWRFGPASAAYAISSGAESNHLGADIAIVHSSTNRILLYQAKLARLNAASFDLKSDATSDQLTLLNQRSVTLDGTTYGVTGRLALYQADVSPFLDRCDPHLRFHWWRPWRWHPARPYQPFERLPKAGRRYYEEILRYGCSPSGVVAAPATGVAPISSVSTFSTWPWEFDTHAWLNGGSPVDAGSSQGGQDSGPRLNQAPEFDDYEASPGEPSQRADAFADQLASQFDLPATRQLFVIVM